MPFFAHFLTVVSQRLERYLADGYNPFFGAFSHNTDNTSLEISVVPIKSNQFAYADARGIEHLQDRAVSNIQRAVHFERVQQTKHIVYRKKIGQRFFLLGTMNQQQRILFDGARSAQITKEPFQRGKFSANRALLSVLRQRGQIRSHNIDIDLAYVHSTVLVQTEAL